jgi:hypothetical protein
MASPRLRTKLSWRLANLKVETKEGFESLPQESLVHTNTNPSAFIALRTQYLQAVPRYLAVRQALINRSAEQSQ